MPNITLSVESDVIKKVRKIAIDRNTTLTAMVRDFLGSVAGRDMQERERYAQKLSETFTRCSRDMGKRTWKREELYDRQ